ncbi:ABC transporter permease [Seleniivibrio woodruffii]|uniref:ABC transporter permease n=1 Tax=Seleniivibrio woodruffii TaxID=1078050 RepID=UPI0026F140EC|nr:ABC transporter permease [Seleniivibrio woodruffii]
MTGSYIAIAGFFLFTVFAASRLELNMNRSISFAALRSVVQMFLMGLVLEYIFRLENVWHVIYFAAFMSFFAAYTAKGRSRTESGHIVRGFLSIYIPSMLGLLPVIFSGAVPVQMNAVLPVAGMVVGNCMNAHSISVDRLRAECKANLSSIQGMLALGLTMDTAAKDSVVAAVRAGVTPVMNNIASLGVVLLPGLAAGLLMAGVSPMKAIVYQLVVMYMIFAVNILTSYLACRMFRNDMVMAAATGDHE